MKKQVWSALFVLSLVAVLVVAAGCGDDDDPVMIDDPTFVVAIGSGTETALAGNAAGGTKFSDVCATGAAAVGVSGTLDAGAAGRIDQLQVECRTLGVAELAVDSYEVTTIGGTTLPLRGAVAFNPGASFTRVCPGNSLLTGFDGRSGLLIDGLGLFCTGFTIAGNPSTGGTLSAGTPSAVTYVGGPGGGAFNRIDCPAGQIAAGEVIRAGDDVYAFGLVCATLVVVVVN